MKRRQFLASAVMAGAAGRRVQAAQQIPKRQYKPGVDLSVVGFGGMIVVGLEQMDANNIVAETFDRGVNYFDVAPMYGRGEAEEKLGPALEPYRKRVFLACKTEMRDAKGARMELERSLKRLRTDHFDLYQFHQVSSMKDVETILAPGGAAEVFLKAREEGKVRFLGVSVHSAEAALALMDRFSLDSILFPLNFVCCAQGNFGPQILARAKEKGIARLALKALAHTTWPKGTATAQRKYPKLWYKPIDDIELARRALRFTLSEDITAAVLPGDKPLVRPALEIASGFKPLTAEERQRLLAETKGIEPIFKA